MTPTKEFDGVAATAVAGRPPSMSITVRRSVPVVGLLLALLLAAPGCGLLNPDYKPQLEALQGVVAQKEAALDENQRANAEAKREIVALQQAQATARQQLDEAIANAAQAHATPGTPPEVTAGFSALVNAIRERADVEKAALAEAVSHRAAIVTRHDELVAEKKAAAVEVRDFKVRSALDATTTGITTTEAVVGGGGLLTALASVVALLRTFGKSRSQPAIEANAMAVAAQKREIDGQWDKQVDLEGELREVKGRLAALSPPTVVVAQPPQRPA